jgi:hypothetical protein
VVFRLKWVTAGREGVFAGAVATRLFLRKCECRREGQQEDEGKPHGFH